MYKKLCIKTQKLGRFFRLSESITPKNKGNNFKDVLEIKIDFNAILYTFSEAADSTAFQRIIVFGNL